MLCGATRLLLCGINAGALVCTCCSVSTRIPPTFAPYSLQHHYTWRYRESESPYLFLWMQPKAGAQSLTGAKCTLHHKCCFSLSSVGEVGSVAVLSRCCRPLSSGSTPGPGSACPCGFTSKLCSHRSFSGYSSFPPASKIGLLLICFCSFRDPSGKQYLYSNKSYPL